MIRSNKFLRGIFIVMVSSALSNCGREKSEESSNIVPPQNKADTTPAQDQTASSTAQLQEPKFKVLKNSSTVRSKRINNRYKDFCALFLILPNIEGLEVLDVKIDEASFHPSNFRDPNYINSFVKFGTFDAKAAEPMCPGEVGLTAGDKTRLVQEYDQGLYAYFKFDSAEFFAPGQHRVKIVAGKNSVNMGEFEFVIEND